MQQIHGNKKIPRLFNFFKRGFSDEIDLYIFWLIIYLSIAVMVLILIPFSIFLYESDEEKPIVLTFLQKIFKK